MSSIELPDDVAAALAAAAAERGLSEAELIAEMVAADADHVAGSADEARRAEALEAFIGCADSGDESWAATDTKVLRAQAAARKATDRI